MSKELVFRLNSKAEVETLIDRLEEEVSLQRGSLDISFGYILRNEDRSLELQVLPKKEGELFEIIVHLKSDDLEELTKQIFGEPQKEIAKDASILDVAEFIVDLPVEISDMEIKNLVKEKFNLDECKYDYFKDIIIRHSINENARNDFKHAAKRLK